MRRPPSGATSILSSAEAIDVDEMRRRLDLELHEIEQVGAAGDELGAGDARRGGRGFGGRLRAFVAEGFSCRGSPRLR